MQNIKDIDTSAFYKSVNEPVYFSFNFILKYSPVINKYNSYTTHPNGSVTYQSNPPRGIEDYTLCVYVIINGKEVLLKLFEVDYNEKDKLVFENTDEDLFIKWRKSWREDFKNYYSWDNKTMESELKECSNEKLFKHYSQHSNDLNILKNQVHLFLLNKNIKNAKKYIDIKVEEHLRAELKIAKEIGLDYSVIKPSYVKG